jgi:hypothetical protein
MTSVGITGIARRRRGGRAAGLLWMRLAWLLGGWWCALLVSAVLWTGGCATWRAERLAPVASPRPLSPEALARARSTVAHLFPRQYRAVHRAILTVGRRQFTCDGVLRVTPDGGWHLAVISSLGLVAELRLHHDTTCEILKVTPLFSEEQSRRYLARDLRWLFLPPPELAPAGFLTDGRMALQAPAGADDLIVRYVFSPQGERLDAVELARRGRLVYRASLVRYLVLPGHDTPIPASFEVKAEDYRMELRTSELTFKPGATGGSDSSP